MKFSTTRYFLYTIVFLSLLSCSTLRKVMPDNSSKNVNENKSSSATTSTKFIYKPKPSDEIIPRGIDFANTPSVIAFGSCAHQDFPQPLWEQIQKDSPDLFLFTGDTVYASTSETKPFQAQYKKLNQIKEFRSFREKVPFMATWDDHDFGVKDGGADNPDKEEARKEFLTQWGYIKDSLKMNQKGIYHAKILGGVKKKSPSVQIIVLDTRWFRSPLKYAEVTEDVPLKEVMATTVAGVSPGAVPAIPPTTSPSSNTELPAIVVKTEKKVVKKIIPNTDKAATILGEEQWQWLERQFRKPANLRILVSSIQFVAENHPYEKWSNFPNEKERMVQLLKKTGVKNLFIVSGDMHVGSIAKMDIKGWGPLFDITASGINRVADVKIEDPSYVGNQAKTENFGLFHVDWSRKKLTVELRDNENKVVNKLETSLK